MNALGVNPNFRLALVARPERNLIYWLWFAKNTYGKMTLRSNPFITVVKSLELWYCDDLSGAQDLARKRTLLAQPQVRSRLMVVTKIQS